LNFRFFLLINLLIFINNAHSAGFRIWGSVIGFEGGLANALIIVDGADSTYTDNRGNYAFDELIPGMHDFLIIAEGYENYRQSVHLIHEAQLPLKIFRFRELSASEKSSETYRPSFESAAVQTWDFDQDGLPDRAGQEPYYRPADILVNTELRSSAFNCAYFPLRKRLLVNNKQSSASSESSSQSGFFFHGSSLQAKEESAPFNHQGRSLRVSAGNYGQQSLEYSTLINAGKWDQLSLNLWTDKRKDEQDDPYNWQGFEFEHRHWFSGFRFYNRLRMQNREYESAQVNIPLETLAFRPMALSIENYKQQGQELAFSSGFYWRISRPTTLQTEIQISSQDFDFTGLENDYSSRRVIDLESDPNPHPVEVKFDTRRKNSLKRLAFFSTINTQHEKGILTLGLFGEKQERKFEYSFSNAEFADDFPDWFSGLESRVSGAALLKDLYNIGKLGAVQANLAVRYNYYELQRYPQSLFALEAIPVIDFNEDLLSLDPRFAWNKSIGQFWNIEIAWDQRKLFLNPLDWLDPDEYVEDLSFPYSASALAEDPDVRDSFGAHRLLVHPSLRLLELTASTKQIAAKKLDFGLRFFHAEYLDYPVAFANPSNADSSLLYGRKFVVSAAKQIENGIDIWLSTDKRKALQFECSILLSQSNSDIDNIKTVEIENNTEIAMKPAIAARFELNWRHSWKNGFYSLISPILSYNSERWLDFTQNDDLSLAAISKFDLFLEVDHLRLPGWRLGIELSNVFDNQELIWATMDRISLPTQVQTSGVKMSGRRWMLSLVKDF
jgi:hypothetical protein